MKNQYFGDVNDYRKYGLLRCLQDGHEGRLLVAWMLTPNDERSDGEFRKYLHHPEEWRCFDPDLYDGLRELNAPKKERRVATIEPAGLLPRATYCNEPVPDDVEGRAKWSQRLAAKARASDLVFLDPDNGIAVPSRPIGRRGSSKYVAWSEIEQLWKAGCSLLTYQHFRREKREEFIHRMLSELQHRTGARFVVGFRTAHVVLLLAAQKAHEAQLRKTSASVGVQWAGQILAVPHSH